MEADIHDQPLSTTSARAAEPYRQAQRLMLSAWPGADEALDAAIAADEGFALAHAARARLHAMHAEPAKAHEAITRAQGLAAAQGTERERSHVGALALAITGPSQAALRAALAHADAWPRDALVLSLPLGAFGLFAFSGMADHDQARVDLCRRHADHFGADDWWFLTSYGWSLAENGEVARGRGMIERALCERRENANAAHALAHAMYEGGAGAQARALIADWLPAYPRAGVLHGHLAWHAALAALDEGDVALALRIYDAQVQPAVSQGLAINVVSDGASFLWRLAAYGHPAPPERWAEIAAYAQRAFQKPGHAFVDTHLALIEAATGQREALARRAAALDEMAARGTLGAGPVVGDIARAAQAFADGDDLACVRILEPVAAEVVRIGGSGAQRQIIEDTLLVAMMRAGQVEKARSLLDRRLRRRPSARDQRWLEGLAA